MGFSRAVRYAAALSALSFPTAPVRADTSFLKTGNDWATDCPLTSGFNSECGAYVKGVADGIASFPVGSPLICVPAGVTMGQVYDVVALGLQNHPESRNQDLFLLSARYLMKAFPCTKK